MKIFITGGAGFIGANVANYYLPKGHSILIYDNLSRPGVKKNLDWLKERFRKNLKIITADVRDYQTLKKNLRGSKIVFHFAGQTAVTTSINNPREDFEANALGTFNVLEALREMKSKAIMLYSSSNKVYGEMGRVRTTSRGKRYASIESPSIDESESLSFYSPYGCSKGCGDQYTQDYARIYGLRTIVFRQSCIYGSHQFGVADQGWVAHFTASALLDQPIIIYGDGKQVRDILYIDDFVRACDRAVKHIGITAGQIYNIGGGISNTVSLLELIELLEKVSGNKMKINFAPSRQGDQPYYVSNIDKACRDFGWRPQITVEAGVRMLYEWLEETLI